MSDSAAASPADASSSSAPDSASAPSSAADAPADASSDAAEHAASDSASGEQAPHDDAASDASGHASGDASEEAGASSHAASDEQPSLTHAFGEAAQEVLEKRLRWVAVLRKAVQRLGEDGSVPAVLANDIATLFRMIQAWRRGTYAHFPWRSLGVITLAVLYFLLMGRSSGGRSLAGLGIIDDTAILAFVVRTTHNELKRFRSWEQAQNDDASSASDDAPQEDTAPNA